MKKILFLVMVLFLMCGCSAEYNLEIKGNDFSEKTIIRGSNAEEIEHIKNYQIYQNAFVSDQISSETNEKVEGVEYYNQEVVNDNLEFSYNFRRNNYIGSVMANNCYQYINFANNSGEYIFSTSKEFLCFNIYPELENVLVKITVDFEVGNHNANKVEGNTYIWNLSKNKSDNSIFLQSKSKKDNNSNNNVLENGESSSSTVTSNSKKNSNGNTILWVCVGLLGFIVVLSIMFRIKKDR